MKPVNAFTYHPTACVGTLRRCGFCRRNVFGFREHRRKLTDWGAPGSYFNIRAMGGCCPSATGLHSGADGVFGLLQERSGSLFYRLGG